MAGKGLRFRTGFEKAIIRANNAAAVPVYISYGNEGCWQAQYVTPPRRPPPPLSDRIETERFRAQSCTPQELNDGCGLRVPWVSEHAVAFSMRDAGIQSCVCPKALIFERLDERSSERLRSALLIHFRFTLADVKKRHLFVLLFFPECAECGAVSMTTTINAAAARREDAASRGCRAGTA